MIGVTYCDSSKWRELSPPNNRAERDPRPAVVASKVSHCSKNERGARAFEAFGSILHPFARRIPRQPRQANQPTAHADLKKRSASFRLTVVRCMAIDSCR